MQQLRIFGCVILLEGRKTVFVFHLIIVDFIRLLLIRVCDSPDHCSVFDHLVRGQVVAISNLVLCESQNSFGFAIGNQHTLVTRYPKDKLLKEALDIFAKEPIEVNIV